MWPVHIELTANTGSKPAPEARPGDRKHDQQPRACAILLDRINPIDFATRLASALFGLCMAGGPGLEPVWRSGPGDPDYTVSANKRVVYTVSGPNRVVRISWSRSPHRLQTWPPGHTQCLGREAAPSNASQGLDRTGPRPSWCAACGGKPAYQTGPGRVCSPSAKRIKCVVNRTC